MAQQPPNREELARLEAVAASLASDQPAAGQDMQRALQDAIDWYRRCLARRERLLSS